MRIQLSWKLLIGWYTHASFKTVPYETWSNPISWFWFLPLYVSTPCISYCCFLPQSYLPTNPFSSLKYYHFLESRNCPLLSLYFRHWLQSLRSFPGSTSGKEPACQCRRQGLNPWVRKMPWRRAWQSTSVFLPGESYGQRCLVDYSP